MKEMIITFKGKQYMRQVEMLGTVESVQWLYRDDEGYTSGVYDQKLLDRLEIAYETIIIVNLTPTSPII